MELVGLVPCAGKGSRLGASFSKEVFPDLHHPNYRPIIMYTIDAMKLAGINHVIFTVNPYKTDLLNFLGNGKQFGMNFSYCIHPVPKSLPESINEAYHLIKDKNVVFAMPDTVIKPIDYLNQMVMNFKDESDKYDALFGCFKTTNPAKFGMVEFEEHTIIKIVDKPETSNLNWMWGSIIWNPNFTEVIKNKIYQQENEQILTDLIEELIYKKKIKGLRFNKGQYKDLGTFGEIKDWIRMEN